MKPIFSICIPNYNYATYIDITFNSLHKQTFKTFEVLVTDNASTDDSVEVIKKHATLNPNIKYKVNPCNIGFAGNLDEVGKMAIADWMIMLSSDDVIKENALETYQQFISAIGLKEKFVFTSTFEKIDGQGAFLEFLSPKKSSVWSENDKDNFLSEKMGFDVYKVAASVMLNRCLTRFLNPFNFASTCYPRDIYNKVGGYGGGRLYNPDKWFHWKVMAECDFVYYLDSPLFQYRWHNTNQANQQVQNQTLKFWVDEYRNSFEVTELLLKKANLNIQQVKKNFIRRCILSYAVRFAKNGDKKMASRILNFGKACYPEHCKTLMFKSVKLISHSQMLSKIIFR